MDRKPGQENIPEGPLKGQHDHWEETFSRKPDMFGVEPSYPACKAAGTFRREGAKKILELGGGQGRDTLFFAREGFDVHVIDYSEEGVKAIQEKAGKLSMKLTAVHHDVRQPLPFHDEVFDGCYSHMLWCMALTTSELETLSGEVRRVLKPGGLNIYTVRNTTDAHYKAGVHRGEDMWETGGFIVHFFDREKIERLAKGYEIVEIEEFEEGVLPRKLFAVTLRKT